MKCIIYMIKTQWSKINDNKSYVFYLDLLELNYDLKPCENVRLLENFE